MKPDAEPATANVLACCLLALMAVLAGGAALRESVTTDEIAHVGAGLSYVQRLDLRMNIEHPPLIKALAGASASLAGIHADYTSIPWETSSLRRDAGMGQWLFGNLVIGRWNRAAVTMRWARLPMVAVMLLLGWAVFRCGSKLGGGWGGLLALALYVSTPLFLAIGPLVHTDVAAALFAILTLWQAAEFWREGARGTWWKFGLVLAGGMLSKFSCVLFIPVALAFWLFMLLIPQGGKSEATPAHRARAVRALLGMLKGLALAVVLTYFAYLLFSWNQPPDILPFSGDSAFQSALRRALWPGEVYWRGLSAVFAKISRPTFLIGHFYESGVWFYFPLLFLVKNTLPFLALCALAAMIFGVGKSGSDTYRPHRRAIWFFLAAFGGAAIVSQLNIGYRHFSIAAALLILLFAGLPRRLENVKWARYGVAGLALASIASAIGAFPNYIPYFNALASVRANFWWTNDSNIDWNQALPAVQEVVERKGLSEILVQETAANDVLPYVPKARLWNCQQEAPADAGKWAAVSASEITFGHNCTWLFNYPHEPLAGGSMYLFQLPSPAPVPGSPTGPPLELEWWTMRIPTPNDLRPQIVGMLDREVPPDAIPH